MSPTSLDPVVATDAMYGAQRISASEEALEMVASRPETAGAAAVPHNSRTSAQSEARRQRLIAAGGIVGALAASSCCIVPLILFSLGISGAWIGNLTALAPWKPLFVVATAGLLDMASISSTGSRGKPAPMAQLARAQFPTGLCSSCCGSRPCSRQPPSPSTTSRHCCFASDTKRRSAHEQISEHVRPDQRGDGSACRARRRADGHLCRRQHDLRLVSLHREELDGGGSRRCDGRGLLQSQDRDCDLR